MELGGVLSGQSMRVEIILSLFVFLFFGKFGIYLSQYLLSDC